MKKYQWSILVIGLWGLLQGAVMAKPVDTALLMNTQGQPTQQLLTLLHHVGMPQEFVTLPSINTWAQEHLLRQGLRWERQAETFEALRPQLLPLLQQLGLVSTVYGTPQEYTGILLHGSILSDVRLRVHHVVQEWQRGMQCTNIYWLVGERELVPELESRALLLRDPSSPLQIRDDWVQPAAWPTTEAEMVQWVWQQAEISLHIREQVCHYFIVAPQKRDIKTGCMILPNTDDIVRLWLAQSPPCGNYLSVSNQPHVYRQCLVVQSYVPQGYSIEPAGAMLGAESMTLVLDELARWIYLIYRYP